jgi:hypothetical protein
MPDPDAATPQTPPTTGAFDFSAYPPDTLFHERRTGHDRRADAERDATPPDAPERRRNDRRKRIDPTTFEKQYTPAELEFMNAMQEFKVRHAKTFPSHGDVLQVAYALGYRRVVPLEEEEGAFEADTGAEG